MGKHEASEDTAKHSSTAPAGTEEFWGELDIDPVEIHLPTGSGITLRHYRSVILPPEPEEDEEKTSEEKTEDEEFEEEPEKLQDVLEPAESEEDEEDSDSAKEEKKKPRRTKELELDDVIFLGSESTVYLFDTPEALVKFLNTAKKHSLSEIENAERLQELTPAMITIDEDDTYELDLVVRNLRGGHDAWDPDLLILAAEGARDLAHATGQKDAEEMMAPGTPIDNLDNGLRRGGFWARRKLRKMNEDTLALTWRSVIGKITSAVEVRK